MTNSLFFSSAKDYWETPQRLFEQLDREFHFDIDVAANEENHKCKTWLGEWLDGSFTNGLTHSWRGLTVWCNPPYGRSITGKWVKKAAESGTTVVMLLPARTDTKWFHEYIYGKAEVRFIKGRLCFELDGKPIIDAHGRPTGAPFPSMIVIFRRVHNDKG